MKMFYFYLILLCSLSFKVIAQKYDNNWLFGQGTPYCYGIGLNFSNQNPVIDTFECGGQSIYSELVSMSDSSGNFIFSTNGIKILDAQHNLMSNGDSINPGYVNFVFNDRGYPVFDGAIGIPHPDSPFLYDIFHLAVDSHPLPFLAHKLYRTQVDMRLNNGVGDVTIKNEIWIEDTLCYGQLSAVKHANGKDWWVIIPESATNGYYSLLIKPNIVEGPFYQRVGQVMSPYDWGGQACFSPDGTKYARFKDTLYLYDFDRCTGELCNNRSYPIYDWFSGGGCAFSQNNRFLYLSTGRQLYQVDMYAPSIDAGILLIADISIDSACDIWSMRLAPDNKIYIFCGSNYWAISVINNPDFLGNACNFEYVSLRLPSPAVTSSLPNFPHYRTPAQDSCPPCGTFAGLQQQEEEEITSIKIYPNPASETIQIEWMLENENKVTAVAVRDALGKELIRKVVYNESNVMELDIRSLPAGLYYCSFFSEERLLETQKIVVVK